MEARYERNIPALTPEECALLRQKRLVVVGCGGLGGHLIDQLARLGVGFLRVVDGDTFEPSNLNRQLLSQVPTLGRSKAKTAAEHIRRVNPAAEAEAVEAFLTGDNALSMLRDCDAVLDALDNIASRRTLARVCAQAGIPYVYGAVSGWVAQAAISLPGDRLIETLYPQNAAITSKTVLSFTPALCAALQVSLCTRLLVGRPVQTGTVYYFDLQGPEFEVIPLGQGSTQ